DDGQHRPAAIGVQGVAGRKENRVVVVDRASRRQPLGAVLEREGDEIRHLLAAGIGDAQRFAAPQLERRAALRLDSHYFSSCPSWLRSASCSSCISNGHFQAPSTRRPEYCAASEHVPKSAIIGFTSPCSRRSRSRITC